MKTKRLIISIILSWLIILIMSVNGQDILTIAETYDYEVGDIFHYELFASGYGGESSITNVEIINRYYSPNNDTLFYIRDIDYKINSSENPYWIFSYYTDTIFYSDLDSLIHSGYIDSIYSDTNFYNGRIINSNSLSGIEIYMKYEFVEGCGQTLYYYHSWDGSSSFMMRDQMVYFKKGNEEWGVPLPVSIEENSAKYSHFSIYPNPAHDWLNFKFQNENSNDSYSIELRNLCGQLIKEDKYLQSPNHSMNVSDLKAGLYFYRIKDNYGTVVLQGKIIIQ